jgi:acyl carrier protein
MKTQQADTKPLIRSFLTRFIQDYDLKDDEDIFALGYVSSLFIMQLVLFAEKKFDIQLDNEDLNVAHFKTVNNILQLIEQKLEEPDMSEG